jgi:hypothetical protein
MAPPPASAVTLLKTRAIFVWLQPWDWQYARTTAASDWVDYALDQQTVTGSGGTVKVSSSYSQTWSNGQNQWFQTNDPNSNPNGVLSGNWTLNTKVHGNGQPQ